MHKIQFLNPDKFVFSQRFSSTRGGGCLPFKSGVPNASSEYMRKGYFLRSFRKLVKIVEMFFENVMDRFLVFLALLVIKF